MKKKSHTPPPPIPPPSSSSSSSTDASESESDDRELQPQATQPAPAGHAKPKPSPPPSESKSEECEDESETSGSEGIMTATPAPSGTNKRRSPLRDPSSAATSGAGRKLFQRLWTDEDELALIKGLVRYNKKHGKDPSTAPEYSAFLDQMKGRLHIEFSKDQFMSKLRTIKRKYTKYLGKVMNGGSITSVKEHDQNCFDLLMKVWGDELKTRSPKKDIKNGDVGVENEAMDSGASGPKKKKKKTEAAGTQVIDNGNGDDDVEAVDGECNCRFVCNVFEDIFNRHNIEASVRDQLKKALLGMEPKELKDWVKRFMSQYNLKWDALRGLNDLDNEFIRTLWTNLKP